MKSEQHMARPKRIEGEPTAYERMEDAFWAMLAEMPYHEMTAKEVCGRAGVSHNTFYYRFQNMDDMAAQMFDRVLTPEVPRGLLAIFAGERSLRSVQEGIPRFHERFARMRLLAGSGSPLLTGMLEKMILALWLEVLGLEESDLTAEDALDLKFIIGGAIAVLGGGLEGDAEVLESFTQREVGSGVLAKMGALASRGNAQS